MNKRRLLKLAGLLDADAKNKKGIQFDLSDYARPAKSGKGGGGYSEQDAIPVNCNTAACAIGLACISGAFKRSGLTYTLDFRGYLWPKYETSQMGDAAELFFDVNEDEFEFLFQPSSYPRKFRKGAIGERFVARRIRDFVAGRAAP